MGCIYKIVCSQSSKVYIGQTADIIENYFKKYRILLLNNIQIKRVKSIETGEVHFFTLQIPKTVNSKLFFEFFKYCDGERKIASGFHWM